MNKAALIHRFEVAKRLTGNSIIFIKANVQGKFFYVAIKQSALELKKQIKQIELEKSEDMPIFAASGSSFLTVKKQLDNKKIAYVITDL